MSQLITGNYVIKLERNSFRVVFVFVCRQSQMATTLAIFLAAASDCTENRGLLAAQALLKTSKLLVFCENAVVNSTLLCFTNLILQKKAGLFLQTALPS